MDNILYGKQAIYEDDIQEVTKTLRSQFITTGPKVAEFEKQNRSLCKKVFDAAALNGMEDLEQRLSAEEKDMLLYYLTSGVYGSVERGVENRVKNERVEIEMVSTFFFIYTGKVHGINGNKIETIRF